VSVLLHLAPHPDDELVGAPATLMALRDTGWQVVNLVLSLGSVQEQKQRREAEAREACRRARFELVVADLPLGPSATAACAGAGAAGELRRVEEQVTDFICDAIAREGPLVVVGPSPHDAHPAHEAVGRAAVAACERRESNGLEVPRLWFWGLWADLPFPTIVSGFGEERMGEILACLEAYEVELARTDYRRLVRGRAMASSSVGPERVFGFGTPTPAQGGAEYVELLCEVLLRDGGWAIGAPRRLDSADPLAAAGGAASATDFSDIGGAGGESDEGGGGGTWPAGPGARIGDWLHSPSVHTDYRR